MQFGVLADDLTGAMASAVRLRDRGIRARPCWILESDLSDAEAVVVDMRTRDSPERGLESAREWARHLRAHGCRRLELRMDSTLRSNTASELRGLVEGAGLSAAIVLAAPAFPDAGRITRDGSQLLAGSSIQPIGPCNVGAWLFPGHDVSSLPLELVKEGSEAVCGRIQEEVERGITRFVADTEANEHLRVLATAVGRLEDEGWTFVTVSPGAWLSYHPVPSREPFALVVLASATGANAQQLATLAGAGASIVKAGSVLAASNPEPDASIVVVETLSSPGDAPSASHARRAAETAHALLEESDRTERRCAGIVVSGGHAAATLVDMLGAVGVQPIRELEALCSEGVLLGGPYDGLTIVTKGGVVGGATTSMRLANSVLRNGRDEY
jgi:D-threonate/D-erythronate kinase